MTKIVIGLIVVVFALVVASIFTTAFCFFLIDCVLGDID